MADDKNQEDAPKKKGKGKLLIIIIAVVVLIVAGVAVKMFVLGGKKKEPAKQTTQQQAQQNENQGQGEYVSDKNLEPVVVGPIIVNLADAGGDRYLKLKLVLLEAKQKAQEAKKEETKTGMSLEDAVIRNAIIITTSAKTSDDLLSVSGKEELKSELITAINKALHRNLVRKIFFTEFIIQ